MSSKQVDILDAVVSTLQLADGVSSYLADGSKTFTYDLSATGAVRLGFSGAPVGLSASVLAQVWIYNASEASEAGRSMGASRRELVFSLLGFALCTGTTTPGDRLKAAMNLHADITGALENLNLLGATDGIRSVRWKLDSVDGDLWGAPGHGVVAGAISITHEQRPRRWSS